VQLRDQQVLHRQLLQIRRRRRAFLVALFAFLPGSIVIALLSWAMLGEQRAQLVFNWWGGSALALLALTSLWWGVSRCPQCGEHVYLKWIGPFVTSWPSSSCRHCGLRLAP
jgi:hypothetical protein